MTTPASTASAWHRRRNALALPTPTQRRIDPPFATPRTSNPPPLPSTLHPPALLRPAPPPVTLPHISALLPTLPSATFRAFCITLLSILLVRLSVSLSSPIFRLVSPCPAQRVTTTWLVFFFKTLLLFPLTLVMLTTMLTYSHLRTISLHTQHPRYRLLQALFPCLVGVPAAVMLSYISYGPDATPYLPCIEHHLPTLLPRWKLLTPQTLHILMSATLFAVSAHLFRLHSQFLFPLKQSFPAKLYSIFPNILGLIAISCFLALPPTLFIAVVTTGTSYLACAHSLIKSLAAICCSFSLLLAMSIALIASQLSLNPPTGDRVALQDHLSFLQSLPNTVAPKHVSIFVKNLRDTMLFDTDISSLALFQDSSGQAWKVCLAYALHPLQMAVQRIDTCLRRAPNTSNLLRPTNKSYDPYNFIISVFATGELFTAEETLSLIHSCNSLSIIYVESVKHDMYGVVHRTLSNALITLLTLKQMTTQFMTQSERWGGRERHAVRAVDDAVVVCVYQIIAVYGEHLVTFANGKEIDWDRRLDSTLVQFLQYQVP